MSYEEMILAAMLRDPAAFVRMLTEDMERAKEAQKKGKRPWSELTQRERFMCFITESVLPRLLSEGAMVAIWLLAGFHCICLYYITAPTENLAALIAWLQAMPK